MADDSRTGSAFVFPGMGPVAFADLARFMVLNPVARKRVTEADAVLGHSLIDAFEAARGEYSDAAQVAFMVTCVALAEWAEQELCAAPELCAAVSFGGKAAAVYTGALAFADAVWLTTELARHEREYFARRHGDLVTYSCARTPVELLEEVLAELTGRGGWYEVSCHIDDDVHLVSLHENEIDWFERRVRARGGLPLYAMRPVMHSTVLAELRAEVEDAVFGAVRFADPAIALVADQDGAVVSTGDGVRRMMLDGYVRTVHWPLVADVLAGRGIGTLHVCGPDHLVSRVRRTKAMFTVDAIDPARALRPRPQRVCD